MAANPVVTANVLRDNQQQIVETSGLNLEVLLAHCEEVLLKAFGDDEQTIANALRGF